MQNLSTIPKMTIQILKESEFEKYLEHILVNPKNSRTSDANLITRVENSLKSDRRVRVFCEWEQEKIIRSVLTIERVLLYEYCIVNYRTSGQGYFNMPAFLDMFDKVFTYYEDKGFYRWLLARELNLLNTKFFDGLGNTKPFNRYVTAIECSTNMYSREKKHYGDLLNGLPDGKLAQNFIVIAGFCKQEYRKLTEINSSSFV